MNSRNQKRDTDCERDGNDIASTPAGPARFLLGAPQKAWLLTWLLAGTRARLKRIDSSFFAILCGPESRICPTNS